MSSEESFDVEASIAKHNESYFYVRNDNKRVYELVSYVYYQYGSSMYLTVRSITEPKVTDTIKMIALNQLDPNGIVFDRYWSVVTEQTYRRYSFDNLSEKRAKAEQTTTLALPPLKTEPISKPERFRQIGSGQVVTSLLTALNIKE